MLAKVCSVAVNGLEAYPVQVEVDLAGGLPLFTVVGLPDATVRESRDRVRSALRNSGFSFPQRRVTVNLAPADLPKEGAGFELPIAVGILAAEGLIPAEALDGIVLAGEVSLEGAIKAVRGVLSMAVYYRGRGIRGLLVPAENGAEAAIMCSSWGPLVPARRCSLNDSAGRRISYRSSTAYRYGNERVAYPSKDRRP